MQEANVVQLETNLDRLWSDYCSAAERAQKTKDMRDGVAAGRAWSRWLAEFCWAGEKP